MKVVLRIKALNDSELIIEGESLREIVEELKIIGVDLKDLLLRRGELKTKKEVVEGKKDLSEVFEITEKGVIPIIDITHLSIRETILLTLYGAHLLQKKGLKASQLISILKERGLPSSTSSIYARIAELKRDGFILKEGDEWKLTKKGLGFVEERILQKILR